VLAEWLKGQQPTLYRLADRIPADFQARDVWTRVPDPKSLFG
jgi:hypothetical protein